MFGPGKYDDEATMVRERTQAQAVILLVAGGNKGDGSTVQCVSLALLRQFPKILRRLADELEADAQRLVSDEEEGPTSAANIR